MSKPRKGLTANTATAKKVAKWLSGLPHVKSVWLCGSRSPVSAHKPRRDSDWDFSVVSDVPNLRLQNIRQTAFKLNADLQIIYDDPPEGRKCVQLFPEDTHEVFTSAKKGKRRKKA